MAEIEIKVPPVGESITEVTIGNWFKNDGDFVKLDEVICGLDSDKATFELTAESEGVLHIKAQEGDTLNIGELIATIDPSGNGSAPAASAPAASAPVAAAAPAAGAAGAAAGGTVAGLSTSALIAIGAAVAVVAGAASSDSTTTHHATPTHTR